MGTHRIAPCKECFWESFDPPHRFFSNLLRLVVVTAGPIGKNCNTSGKAQLVNGPPSAAKNYFSSPFGFLKMSKLASFLGGLAVVFFAEATQYAVLSLHCFVQLPDAIR
jgi:hypothetical protein